MKIQYLGLLPALIVYVLSIVYIKNNGFDEGEYSYLALMSITGITALIISFGFVWFISGILS